MPLLDNPTGRIYEPDLNGNLVNQLGNEASVDPAAEAFGVGLGYDDRPEDMGIDPAKLTQLSRYVQQLHAAYDGSATRKKILQAVADSRRAYYTELEETDFPWDDASNMITPLTTMGVDEVEPRLVAAVIGREPYLSVKKTAATDTEEARAIETFDNFVLEQKIKVKELVPEMVHEQLLDGTIYPLLSWEEEVKDVLRNQIVPDQNGMPQLQKAPAQVKRSGPRVTLTPVEFVWHADDLDEEDWEDATVIRYVGEITVGEILQRSQTESGWIIPDENRLKAYSTSTKKYKTITQQSEGVQDYGYVMADNQRPIEFFEAYVKYPLFDGQPDQKLILLVEVNHFEIFRIRLQIETNDENIKPLRRMRFLKRKGISWGYPLYTLIAGIQLGMDAMWNRCVNSADITMTPWGFIKRGGSGIRDNQIQVYPGNLIELDNPEAVNFPNLSAFQPAQFVPLILQYVSFFERTLNVSDFMQGRESQISGKKGTTATGTLAILQEGKIKFEYRGGLTHNEFLAFFKNIHDLCVSHMPLEEMMKICGRPMTNYSSNEEYLFLLSGSDVVNNRFVERQETESLLATVMPFMDLINPMAPVSDLLYSYKRDPQEWIDPELMAMVQQYLMVKKNAKAIAAMGIPEPVAKQLAQQGATPENVQEFAKTMGREAGKKAFQPEEEKEEKE